MVAPGARAVKDYGRRCGVVFSRREGTLMGRGFALFAGTTPEIIRASVREAEALGYSSFWVNHPGSIDGLASLAHAAGETKRIELGIGVIPLHTRGPEAIVQGVHATKLPLDRLLLGVGSPNPNSLDRVRDGVAAIRSQLKTRLVVAALGPKMCRLAGEIADGVLFNWLTPEHARLSADSVRMGVKPVETCIAAQQAEEIPRALAKWDGAVDEVVLRAITAEDTIAENTAL